MRRHITTPALAALVFASAPAWGAPDELYRITDREPVFQEETAAIAGVVDEVEVALDTTALDRNPRVLELELTDGRRLTVTRARFSVEKGYLTWIGEAAAVDGGTPGYVHLVDHGDQVSGILNVGSDRYQIVATALGGHRLFRVQAGDGAVCALEDSESRPADVLYLESEGWESRPSDLGVSGDSRQPTLEDVAEDDSGDGSPRPDTATKSTTTIDVLAVYPQDFSGSAETAVRNFIQTSVSIANDVFVQSNVSAQYRLVEMARLSGAQPPATGLFENWTWINTEPQETVDLRDEHSADMVALFIPLSYDDDNPCGVANLPDANGDIVSGAPYGIEGPFGDRAFTVHRSGCGLNDFTFAHELGHNFGMRHDNENTSSIHLFPTGRGHVLSFSPWQANANGSLETDVPGDFAVGYHFTPQEDGLVLELGGLFNGSRVMRLFEKDSGMQLGQTTVTSANNWSYRFIPPVYVRAGTTYTVAVYLAGSGGSIYSNVTPFPQTYGTVWIEGTTFVSTLGDPSARPTNTVTDVMYGQADIRFAPYSSVMGCVREPGGDITGSVCSRIPHFSDPAISYQGFVTGTADRNNGDVARAQVGPYSEFRGNHAPVCADDFLTTPMDTRLSIPLGHLLGNDTDPDGDGLWLWSYDLVTAQGGTNDTGHAGGFNYTPPVGFTGTDWFNYTIADRGDGTGLTDTCVGYVEVTPTEEDFGEVGKVTNLTHAPQTVILSRSYANPVVIAQPPSQNGSHTSVVRITSVQSDRFTFYIDEAPNMDGSHTTETVSYMVLEAGDWQLADGTELRAGRLQTSNTVGRSVANNWAAVSFGGTFPTAPVVLSQVQTNNDPSWVKTRHASVGTSSFLVGLEKEEASTVSHGSETVGWVAIQPASGTWTTHAYLAGRTPNSVTDAWYVVSFGGSFATPHLFAAMATYHGPDNAELRYRNLGLSSVEVRVEEDTTLDAEVAHASEVVDYLVIGSAGTLTGARQ
ncbi:MAG: hypothetical protein GY719_30645 [bacterium]|nr:hypothetical protein [bacterium]